MKSGIKCEYAWMTVINSEISLVIFVKGAFLSVYFIYLKIPLS